MTAVKNEKSFFEIFENLDDPRDNRGKIYPLIDSILLALYGVLVGYSDFTNMSYLDLCQYFGQKKWKAHAVFLSSSSSFCWGVI